MEINRIDPSYWFASLKRNELQLLVYGNGLKGGTVETTIPHTGITVKECLCDKYLLVTIKLCCQVPAGKYFISFHSEKDGTASIPYEFKPRSPWGENGGATLSNRDALYMVMVDRFAKGGIRSSAEEDNNPNSWHGGNILGMKNALPYLRRLGITALWHSPIFKNSEYHGYSITDHYDVDGHFGTKEGYADFVDEAHRNGIKVVADFIFNHCSIAHPWVVSPPLEDWFNGKRGKSIVTTNYRQTTIFDPYASGFDRKKTVEGWFTEKMPDLNLKSPYVFSYLLEMSIWWIETFRIDAIRMDTYLYSDLDAMIEWQRLISEEYPGFSVIAETWIGDAAYTAKVQRYVRQRLDANSSFIVMDFAFQGHIDACFNRFKVPDKEAQVYQHFVYDFLYDEPQSTLAFLDNHDLPRWCSRIKGKAKLQQALAVLLTSPRIPQIYYGTEFMFAGDGKGTGDGNYRQDAFQILDSPDVMAAGVVPFLRKILEWRKGSRAVTKGRMKHFIPQQGVYVYFRQYGDEKVMVVVNGTSKRVDIDLSQYVEELDGYTLGIDVITDKKMRLDTPSFRVKSNNVLILNLGYYDGRGYSYGIMQD